MHHFLWLIPLWLLSCSSLPTAPEGYTTSNIRRIFPVPTTFEPAFNEMVACAGTYAVAERTFSGITWLQADRILKGGQQYAGLWSEDNHSIVLSRVVFRGTWDLRVVQHESLHHLLWPRMGHGQSRFHECDPMWWLFGPAPPGKEYWVEVQPPL